MKNMKKCGIRLLFRGQKICDFGDSCNRSCLFSGKPTLVYRTSRSSANVDQYLSANRTSIRAIYPATKAIAGIRGISDRAHAN
jgi:hypothetical protein